jgi:hypothetical protein
MLQAGATGINQQTNLAVNADDFPELLIYCGKLFLTKQFCRQTSFAQAYKLFSRETLCSKFNEFAIPIEISMGFAPVSLILPLTKHVTKEYRKCGGR